MSRCAICDCSQSADSIYNDGVSVPLRTTNNRVVYNTKLGIDICLSCLEDHTQAMNFWRDVDGGEEFNAFPDEDEDVQQYVGCTDKQTD